MRQSSRLCHIWVSRGTSASSSRSFYETLTGKAFSFACSEWLESCTQLLLMGDWETLEKEVDEDKACSSGVLWLGKPISATKSWSYPTLGGKRQCPTLCVDFVLFGRTHSQLRNARSPDSSSSCTGLSQDVSPHHNRGEMKLTELICNPCLDAFCEDDHIISFGRLQLPPPDLVSWGQHTAVPILGW